MKRWTWNIFCLISLLLFALSVTIWIRSYFAWEYFERDTARDVASPHGAHTVFAAYQVAWVRGKFRVGNWQSTFAEVAPAQSAWQHHNLGDADGLIQRDVSGERLNLHVGDFQILYGLQINEWMANSYRYLAFPLWLFFPAAIPPILWWRRRRKQGGKGFQVAVTSATDQSGDRDGAKDAKTAAKG